MKISDFLQAISFLAILTPTISQGNTPPDNSTSNYRFTVGVKLNSVDFDIYYKDDTDTNGTLSEDFSYAPVFRLGSSYIYIETSNWGGLMEYSFSNFSLNQQTVNNKLIDLGTSVNGYYLFATPTLFYSFNIQNTHAKEVQSLVAGLGIGAGYLKATGDMIFTESTQEKHDFDISGAALAVSLFLDYRIGNFSTRISGGLTSHSKENYDYDSFGFEWEFNYIFAL